jgi:Tol biopolymer transport system component
MITNRRGVFDVVVVDGTSGERIKTIVSGADNPMFEELNILNPNLSWSPDGSKITLSSKSDGSYNLAIVDYETLNSETIRFPSLDGINSVAWSPDGNKIAFDGNRGPYQDIYIYNLPVISKPLQAMFSRMLSLHGVPIRKPFTLYPTEGMY